MFTESSWQDFLAPACLAMGVPMSVASTRYTINGSLMDVFLMAWSSKSKMEKMVDYGRRTGGKDDE